MVKRLSPVLETVEQNNLVIRLNAADTNFIQWFQNITFLIEAKDICKISNNCLVNTARHLAKLFSGCLKGSFLANLNSVSQKRWLDILKRHLRGIPKVSPRHYYDEAVFNISKRQLFCKSNQCLSKALFRQFIHVSANCLGRISGCLAIIFCEI